MDELATKKDFDQFRLTILADLREQFVDLKMWYLKLVVAQTALWIIIVIAAMVVAGVLWG
ncbi:MAG: hypothetical protein OXG38_07835 [Chloroflexi bacterium]|nr:hypothetical protein [Chloroflexota bacterium]